MVEVNTLNGLRVLMVSAAFRPSTGGMETHVAEVSRRLRRSGIDVGILTTDTTGTLPAREMAGDVEIRRVRAYPPGRDWCFAPGVAAELRRGRWDLVHVQGYHTFVAPIALATAWTQRIPTVLTFHSGGLPSAGRARVRGAQVLVLRPLIREASALVAVSTFERDHLAAGFALQKSRFTVIPNGSDLPAPTWAVRPVDPAAPLIVSVGRLERYKGHQRAIAALPLVRDELPEARLDIIGSGPYEPELRRQAADLGISGAVRIRSIPGDDRQQMADVLASADLVTLLSEYESQGIAALEAIALGRPTLVAEATALAELVKSGQASAVAVDASPEETAAAMLRAMQLPPQTTTVPSCDDCARQIMALYRRVLGST